MPQPPRRIVTRLAGEVVDEADARRDLERGAVLQLGVDALAGLERAVEAVRVRRQTADEAAVDGVGGRRRDAGARSSADPCRAGSRRARVGADADRRYSSRPPGGVELVGQEVRGLLGVVPLRRQVVEADAVVERQLACRPPVVLHVELEVRVAPFGDRELVGLRVGVEHAGRGVGVAVTRVERVVGVVGEVDAAVEAREDALRLVAVLVVEAGLGVVRAEQLGEVDEHVVGDVLVGERPTVGLVLAGVGRAAAAELEPGHVVTLHGIGIEVRQRRRAGIGADTACPAAGRS